MFVVNGDRGGVGLVFFVVAWWRMWPLKTPRFDSNIPLKN